MGPVEGPWRLLASSLKRTLPVALAVSLLTAGCAGDVSAPGDESTDVGDTSSASVTESISLMPAGPLALLAAEYWAPGESTDDIATVRVGGCDGTSTCPAFAIVTGADAAANGDDDPYLGDGIGCPGGDGLEAVSGTEVSSEPAVVAGADATLETFRITCADSAGNELALTQRQWRVESPDGPVIVVDRWSFEGLSERLADGQWVADGQ